MHWVQTEEAKRTDYVLYIDADMLLRIPMDPVRGSPYGATLHADPEWICADPEWICAVSTCMHIRCTCMYTASSRARARPVAADTIMDPC